MSPDPQSQPTPEPDRLEVATDQAVAACAIAFSRTGDPATGDFRDAIVLPKFGDVPDDLSAL
jgi:hypothetical protein